MLISSSNNAISTYRYINLVYYYFLFIPIRITPTCNGYETVVMKYGNGKWYIRSSMKTTA